MNDLARGDLGRFANMFSPSMKLASRQTVDGKTRRTYDRPLTPLARVLASGQVSAAKKEELKAIKDKLNPFDLEKRIRKQLAAIDKIRRALE